MSAEQVTGVPDAAPSVGPEAWIDALNQQAQRCADEISRRSTTQQAIEGASISASAALAGIVVTGNSSPLLLLLIPVVAAVFANQWLDHHRTITRLGDYLASHVEPELRSRLGLTDHDPFQFWEGHWRKLARGGHAEPTSRRAQRRGRALWVLPIVGLFVGVSLLVLAVSFRPAVLDPASAATHGLGSAGIEAWPRIVWGVDLVVVALVSRILLGELLPRRQDEIESAPA